MWACGMEKGRADTNNQTNLSIAVSVAVAGAVAVDAIVSYVSLSSQWGSINQSQGADESETLV